jgi:hypothetical protein
MKSQRVVATFASVVTFALAAAAQGPPPSSPEARERMQALAGMVGEWEGEAWSEMRPGVREVAVQRESVEWAAEGEALLVRGSGSVEGRVVHEAVGLIFWDARAQRYSMWAYRAGSGRPNRRFVSRVMLGSGASRSPAARFVSPSGSTNRGAGSRRANGRPTRERPGRPFSV